MATLSITLRDDATKQPIAAKVSVEDSLWQSYFPTDALHRVGPGKHFFYVDGETRLEIPPGRTFIEVWRGTEWAPVLLDTHIGAEEHRQVEVVPERWTDLGRQGWHSGNTHLHYQRSEEVDPPDRRLALEPRAEDLHIVHLHLLTRVQDGAESPYSTNRYPIGPIHQHGEPGKHIIWQGEESRHNETTWKIGLGHILLMDIKRVVEPVSRGLLLGDDHVDYPPITYACREAMEQGGTVAWPHEGEGMEVSVATALGHVHLLALFDGQYPNERRYETWYRLLDCGFRLPCTSGTDWYINSNNRVYVNDGPQLDFSNWLARLREGRSFATNHPVLELAVNGEGPGGAVNLRAPDQRLRIKASAHSPVPFDVLQIIANGRVILEKRTGHDGLEARIESESLLPDGGWLAARCWGKTTTSLGHPVWAHTSPIYVLRNGQPRQSRDAARWFASAIDRAIDWVNTRARFDSDAQREEVEDLFRRAQDVYAQMSKR